jgi:hypothetical protein
MTKEDMSDISSYDRYRAGPDRGGGSRRLHEGCACSETKKVIQ